jgi:hypothetical protein
MVPGTGDRNVSIRLKDGKTLDNARIFELARKIAEFLPTSPHLYREILPYNLKLPLDPHTM